MNVDLIKTDGYLLKRAKGGSSVPGGHGLQSSLIMEKKQSVLTAEEYVRRASDETAIRRLSLAD